MRVIQNVKVAGREATTLCLKMLKHSAELGETAEMGDNLLWAINLKHPFHIKHMF